MKKFPAAVFLLPTIFVALLPAQIHSLSHLAAPVSLRCSQQNNPLAVPAGEVAFSWQLHAASPALRGVMQSAYRIQVTTSVKELKSGRAEVWDSRAVSSDSTLNVPYTGTTLHPGTTYFWRVQVWDGRYHTSPWSQPASFTIAPAALHAEWIAAPDQSNDEGNSMPMPIFRHAFLLAKQPVQALLYVSGLGQYEAHINGSSVTNNVLTPAWTDYRKTISYDTYDVTPLLHAGANAIGILLGNGMYNARKTPHRYTKFVSTFGPPKLLALLRITYADGTLLNIATNTTWKTAAGPITFSSIYGGEDYDARREQAGWDQTDFDDTAWQNAIVVRGPSGQLIPGRTPPVRVMQTYLPIRRTEPKPGIFVYDLGQNFAGWPAVRVTGPRGATLRLTPGELLRPDGTVSQQSSGGPAWFAYTLKGTGVESWHPRFSYYGFRYVQARWESVSTAAPAPRLLSIAGQAVHSSAAVTGNFQSSVPLLDRIHALILAAMHNNTVSILTDCPHREKLGWLEQTHLMASALMYDNNLQRLYQALNRNLSDAQGTDGMVPTIAPQYTSFPPPYGDFNNSPEWGSAAVLAPWYAYQRYGDMATLAKAYPTMLHYVEYLTSRTKHHILEYGLGDWYDIGPNPPGREQLTSLGVTATAIYYQDLQALAQTADLLGYTQAATHAHQMAADVRTAFNAAYYHQQTHSYDRNSQTANAMALALHLEPAADQAPVLANLIADVRAHHDHITAGDIGYHYVVQALEENHRSDVLLATLLRTDPPSYGSQLAAGATSLTEAWDANPNGSQDHFMLGDAEQWFYHGLAGIGINFAADKEHRITIEPAVLHGITSASASYHSVLGTIRSAWRQQPGGIAFDITIPANTVATVIFPSSPQSALTESGRKADKANGVTLLNRTASSVTYRVTSGTYHFAVTSPRL